MIAARIRGPSLATRNAVLSNVYVLLALKMATAATIVVFASVIAERSRPFIAAMVATLPVSAGPALVFLAMEHDDAFMYETLIGAIVTNMATTAYSLAYVVAAQTRGTVASIGFAFVAWTLAGLVFRPIGWTLPLGMLGTLLTFGVAIPLARRFASNARTVAPPRAWFAIPLRALAVATLVAAVTTLSLALGPYYSGMLAVFPIVLTSIIAILQPRIGGKPTSALIANGLVGLLGFGVAVGVAAYAIPFIGRYWALALGLAVCLAWNGALVVWRLVRAQPPASERSR